MEQVKINLTHYDKLQKANRDLQSLIKELESKADLKVEYRVSNTSEYYLLRTTTLLKDAELKVAYATFRKLRKDNQELKTKLNSYNTLKLAYDKYVNMYDKNEQIIKDLQKVISSKATIKVNLLFKVLHYLHLI